MKFYKIRTTRFWHTSVKPVTVNVHHCAASTHGFAMQNCTFSATLLSTNSHDFNSHGTLQFWISLIIILLDIICNVIAQIMLKIIKYRRLWSLFKMSLPIDEAIIRAFLQSWSCLIKVLKKTLLLNHCSSWPKFLRLTKPVNNYLAISSIMHSMDRDWILNELIFHLLIKPRSAT